MNSSKKRSNTTSRGIANAARRKHLAAIAGTLMSGLLSVPFARAQAFPSRPIRLILPFPPGGSTDLAGRLIADEMRKTLGQPVFVDNKPGAGGTMGVDMVARSAADGYTLGFSGSGATLLLALVGQPVSYNADRDLSLIGRINTIEFLLVARNDFPAKNVAELIQYAKANPGKVTYGSAGAGGPNHLLMEQLAHMTGMDLVHVPYKGDVPTLTDIMSGVLDLAIVSAPGGTQLVKAGKVHALALCGPERMKALPSVQLVKDSVPGFELFTWTLLVGPAGIPPAVVARLNEALNAALKNPAVRDRFEEAGMSAAPATEMETRAFLAKERVKWSKIIAIPGIKLKE